jgi:hypothetical protein
MGPAPLEGIAVKVKVMITLLAGMLIAGAATGTSEQQEQPKATVIVVVGAAGAPQYAEQFAEWAGLWEQACSKGDARFIAIGLEDGQSADDRTILQEALAAESQETVAALWLVLMGHGTFDGRTAKFNLRGPDVSADDLAEWLEPMLRPVAAIDAASASAPFLKKLSAPDRVVVTATKSGFEHNYARFGQYLAGAIADPQADLDKDGQTSLLEAFLTASGRVGEFYSTAGRLVTEHALIDDNGDGVRSEAERRMPVNLTAQRDRLELEVMKLRDARDDFPEDEYFSKLEALLYQITQIYEQTDQAGDTAE